MSRNIASLADDFQAGAPTSGAKPEKIELSIVIGTKDRPDSLMRTLECLAVQTRLPDEVVLIDDGHLDRAAVGAWSQRSEISLIYENKSGDPGLSKSRNLGVRRSRGRVILFLDDDVLLEPGYLAALLAVYENDPEKRIGGVGGCILRDYRRGVRPFLRFFGLDSRHQGRLLPSGFAALFRGGEGVTPVDWLSGCNMSYRREVFERLKFDEGFTGNGWGDDKDFSFRVGRHYRLVATPAARLVHVEDPAGRANPERFGFLEIHDAYRFFRKNMPQRLWNRLAFGWAVTGILLKNALLGRGRQLLGNLKGVFARRTSPMTPRRR